MSTSTLPEHPRGNAEPVLVALATDELQRLQITVELTARRLFRLGNGCDGTLRRGLIVAADDLACLHLALRQRLPS